MSQPKKLLSKLAQTFLFTSFIPTLLSASLTNHQELLKQLISLNKNNHQLPIGDHQILPSIKYRQNPQIKYTNYLSPDIKLRSGIDAININDLINSQQTKELIKSLNKETIKQDIINSLHELIALYPKISIDFTKLELEFDLNNDLYDTTTLINFKLKFTVINRGNRIVQLFNNYLLNSQLSTLIEINIAKAVIYLQPQIVNYLNTKAWWLSWNLSPINNNISIKTTNLSNNKLKSTSTIVPKKFQILNSHSYYWNTIVLDYQQSIKDFDLVKKGNYFLAKTNPQELKKDINDWLLTYWRYQSFMQYANLEKIMQYLIEPNCIIDFNNKKVSLLQAIIENNQIRNQFLNLFQLNPKLQQFISSLISQKKDGQKANYQEIGAFLKYLLKINLSEIFNKQLTLKTIWYQDPILDHNNPLIPKISFSVKLEVIFNQDIDIQLKGTHEFNGHQVNYDMSKYIGVNHLFTTILNSDNIIENYPTIFNNLTQTINFDHFKIAAGESIITHFKADNSPLIITNQPSFDFTKSWSKTYGFKVTDVAINLDLSNMKNFFYSFYQNLNQITWDGSEEHGLGGIRAMHLIDQPFNLENYLKILDFLFVDSQERKKAKLPLTSRNLRPLEKIFNNLITQPFSISNIAMNINMTRAFNYLPNQIQNISLWNLYYQADQSNDPIISKNNEKIKKISYFGNTTFLPKDQVKTAYYANPEFDLKLLLPYNNQQVHYYSFNKPDAQSKYQNINQFNLIWKHKQMMDMFYNHHNLISKKAVIFQFDDAFDQINQTIAKITNRSQILGLKTELEKILNEHLINPWKSQLSITPSVSIVQIPLINSLNQLLEDGLQPLFKNYVSKVKKIINDNFITDPYLIIINLKVGVNLVIKMKGQHYYPNQSTISFKFMMPKINNIAEWL